MRLLMFTLAFLTALTSFGQPGKLDLVIKRAKVFDSRTGSLLLNQTILIKGGIIAKVTGSQKNYAAAKTIDAGGGGAASIDQRAANTRLAAGPKDKSFRPGLLFNFGTRTILQFSFLFLSSSENIHRLW